MDEAQSPLLLSPESNNANPTHFSFFLKKSAAELTDK
jgi:hypothetical protein